MIQVDRVFHWIITALHYFNPVNEEGAGGRRQPNLWHFH